MTPPPQAIVNVDLDPPAFTELTDLFELYLFIEYISNLEILRIL